MTRRSATGTRTDHHYAGNAGRIWQIRRERDGCRIKTRACVST